MMRVGPAMESVGSAYLDLGAPRAFEAWDSLVARFGDARYVEIMRTVASTMRRTAWALLESGGRADGGPQRAVSVVDDLLTRFGDVSDEGVQLRVAQALRQRAYALGVLRRFEEEVATYDEMVRRFADVVGAPQIVGVVADGLARKASTLETLGRIPEAVDALDEAIVLLHGSEDPQRLKQRLSTVVDKGLLLWRADRGIEATVAFEGAVAAYRAHGRPVRI